MAEVNDADEIKRLVAAITYKKIGDLTQAGATSLYGCSSSWASKWFNRLKQLANKPSEEVVYNEPRPTDRNTGHSIRRHALFADTFTAASRYAVPATVAILRPFHRQKTIIPPHIT